VIAPAVLGFALVAAPTDAPCRLDDAETRWIQSALTLWQAASHDLLHRREDKVPWMILFDRRCTFHVEPDPGRLEVLPLETSLELFGRSLRVIALPHSEKVELPGGKEIGVEVMAATQLYGEDRKPYLVAALPEVWRADEREKRVDPEKFPLGVVVHEMVHTLHLARVSERIERIRKRHAVPEHVSDDTIQEVFGTRAGYRDAYEKERDLLRQALEETDDGKSRALVGRALEAMELRRKTFFRGKEGFYADLDELFLMMEGVAVWTHAELARRHPELVEFDRSKDPFWSQDEGWLLFQLIDRYVPGWQDRVLGDEMATPGKLLRRVAGRGVSRAGAR
jgi:hypothetical protein